MRTLLLALLLTSSAANAAVWPTADDVELAAPRCADARADWLDWDRSSQYRAEYKEWLRRQGASTKNYDAFVAKREAPCPAKGSR